MKRSMCLWLCLVGTGMSLLPWGSWAAEPPAKANAKASTHTVKAGPMVDRVALDGVIESAKHWPLRVRLKQVASGTSLEVIEAVKHGDRVTQGQVLVRFKTEAADRALAAAERAEAAASTALDLQKREVALAERVEAMGLASAKRAHLRADLVMKRFLEINKPLLLKSAQISLKSAERRLESQNEELKQLEKMYKEDDLTEETEEIILKRQKFAVEYAQYSLKQAKATYDNSVNIKIPQSQEDLDIALKSAKLSLDRALATLPLKTTQAKQALAKAEVAHQAAARTLKRLRSDRKQYELKSPAAGVVYFGRYSRGKWVYETETARGMKVGGRLMPNIDFLAVLEPKPSRVYIAVNGIQKIKLTQQAAASFEAHALPGVRWSAKLDEVAPLPLASTHDAWVTVDWPKDGAGLKPGMRGKVRFDIYRAEKAVTVPLKALQYDAAQKPFVWLQGKDKKSQKRSVKLGHVTQGEAEIKEGLSEGDVVELK